MKLQELITEQTTSIYIDVSGRAIDDDWNDEDVDLVYEITVPSDKAQGIIDQFKSAEVQKKLEDEDLIDRFQDDLADEADGDVQNVSDVFIHGVSLKKPSGKTLKNDYRMVYLFRDLGLIDQKLADSIAK